MKQQKKSSEPKIPFVPSRGFARGKYKLRTNSVLSVCYHTTGSGLHARWARDNKNHEGLEIPSYAKAPKSWSEWKKRRGLEPYPFDTAIRVYASLMDAGPHLVLCGETGRIAQMCPFDRVAWHVGSRIKWLQKRKYKNGKMPKWWKDRWQGYNSPYDFYGGRLYKDFTPNEITYGVEIAPPRAGINAPLSPKCLSSLIYIQKLMSGLPGASFDPVLPVMTHSDFRPLARGTKHRPTDLNANQWTSNHFRLLGNAAVYGGRKAQVGLEIEAAFDVPKNRGK